MIQILMTVLVLTTSQPVHAEFPTEVQAAIQSVEANKKACADHGFRPYREKKLEEVSREDYFNLKSICTSYGLSSTLRAVQNINKLEKENLVNISNLTIAEQSKNIESRVEFLTTALLETPMTFAEALIFLVSLREYTLRADKIKNKDLIKNISALTKKLKSGKEKIYTRTLQHDIETIMSESSNTSGGDPKEIESFKKFVESFVGFSHELKKHQSCLAKQKCKICEGKVENKCSEKNKNLSIDENLKMVSDRYADATFYFFKRINEL
jgi:hypothetical protein